MASFPTSVKSFSARTSGETIAASHINDLQDEVAAIEADLINGLTNTLKPISNDGAALGTSALSWSDLFLASGGVLNFNNGDVTITHSANALAFAGASSGYTFDSTLAWGGGSAISSSSNVATLSGTQTFTGRKTISFAGGGDYVAEFMNTTAATPYTVWIKEPAAAVSGYPLLAITNNSASSTWFRVDSGTGATTLGGNVFLAATKVLYLDGGSNTYIYEPSGDKIHLVTNGVVGLNVQENYIAIPATNKLYLDGSNGAGSNTYIYEEAADTISFYAGGTRRFQVASSGVTVESAASAFTVHPTATFTGNIRMTSGYTISWSSDDYRIFRNGDTLRFDQAGVQALLFSGSQAATFAGTLAWGGGSAISSSSNVALLNGANTFTNNNTFSEDVRIYRSGGTTTGYINFGSTGTNYFGYSGTGFVVNGSLNVGTLLTVSGLGTHSFSAGGTGVNAIRVNNTTSGTSNYSSLELLAGTTETYLNNYSQGFTTSGLDIAASFLVKAQGSGGLSLAATTQDVRIYSRNTLAATFGASQAATFTGLISATAFGTHSFSAGGTGGNNIAITNTTSGTGNQASVTLTAGTNVGAVLALSQGYTTSGPLVASATLLYSEGAGGISVSASGADGDVRLYNRGGTLALTLGASQAASFTGDLSIPATKKLYLDGGSDTYIYEISANAVRVVTGGTAAFQFSPTGQASLTDFSLEPTKKLYLDGGGDTYITESSANKVTVYAGGYGNFIFMGVSGGPVFNLSNVGFGVGSGDKIYFDATAASGGGDTYIYEGASNNIYIVTGGTHRGGWNASGVYVNTYPTTASAANLWSQNGSNIHISTSSIRYKHDIDTLDTDHALSAVMAMRPVTYRGKTDEDQRRHVGFIAEEVAEIAPLLATYDEGGESGTPNYVTYDRVTAYLVAVVQKQQAEIDALKARIQ